MKTEQVDKALIQKFCDEDERLVFWHDSDGEFAEYVADSLPKELSEVRLLEPSKLGGFSTKLLLEREDTKTKYLVYTIGAQPEHEQDWLLDIRLYSAEFHADVTSIWLQELELDEMHLKNHLKIRGAFLRSQERRKRLKKLIETGDDASAIDRKMVAVIVGSDQADAFSILRAICHSHVSNGKFDLASSPNNIEDLQKMGLLDEFWGLIEKDFGYSEDEPKIAALLRRILVSEFKHQLDGAEIPAIAQYSLAKAGQLNAGVCLAQWRDSATLAGSYDAIADAVAEELNLKVGGHLSNLPLVALTEASTFFDADKRVFVALQKQVLEQKGQTNLEEIKNLAKTRQIGHWLGGPTGKRDDRKALSAGFDALMAAAEFFTLIEKHGKQISFSEPEELLSAYQSDLYRIDQTYRHFCLNASKAQKEYSNQLKDLGTEIEKVYDAGFLQPLGLEWSRLLDAGFLDKWKHPDMPAQYNFYKNNIKPHLDSSEKMRAYVIISDAFRYEAAHELAERVNAKINRVETKLEAMLSVLPSYTALGMASLLPHKELAYQDGGVVLADGKSTSGFENRHKILQTVEGMACTAHELTKKKTKDAREFTQGAKVVYIYHDQVDSRGDNKSTEGEAFDAVDDAVEELTALVRLCVNSLNAGKIWVTADHGFLFQHSPPVASDKSELSVKPDNVIVNNKRFILGRQLTEVSEAHIASTKTCSGTEDDVRVLIPRTTNRFNFQGGSRFVHGGAMPQEVVVPVLTIKSSRDTKKIGYKVKKVGIQIIGHKHIITTPQYRFQFVQTDSVDDRLNPLTVKVAIYDGATPVTKVESMKFDFEGSLEERQAEVTLVLGSFEYDKKKPYLLIARDAETDAEVLSLPVTIDRDFTDDFNDF